MFFKLTNTANNTIDELKYNIKTIALAKVFLFKVSQPEKKLDEYLKQHFHIGLKPFCRKYINGIKISKVNNVNDIIIYNINNQDDYLASLITYGNATLQGSSILQNAFNQDIII